jgi:hypothetical protein
MTYIDYTLVKLKYILKINYVINHIIFDFSYFEIF